MTSLGTNRDEACAEGAERQDRVLEQHALCEEGEGAVNQPWGEEQLREVEIAGGVNLGRRLLAVTRQ